MGPIILSANGWKGGMWASLEEVYCTWDVHTGRDEQGATEQSLEGIQAIGRLIALHCHGSWIGMKCSQGQRRPWDED